MMSVLSHRAPLRRSARSAAARTRGGTRNVTLRWALGRQIRLFYTPLEEEEEERTLEVFKPAFDGDDDSGLSLNVRIEERLYRGRRYVLRVRLYLSWEPGTPAVMMW